MLKSFTSLTSKIFSNNPYSLQQQQGFPFLEWSSQKNNYDELKSWYTGSALDETLEDSETGKKIDRYPIKINPLKGTCAKHTAVLFGLTVDSMHLGGMPISFVPGPDKKTKKRAREVLDIIHDVFSDNNAGSMFITSGITSQYLGGCVFSARWRPDLNKIEISSPGADELIAIPDGTDYFRLKEAWIVREISYIEARSYFPDIPEGQNIFYYTEHWTPKEYEIAINGVTIEFDGIKAKGINPFGVVPIVYIPHIRDGHMIGKSLITEAVKGIIKEMNLRFADIGDAISDDSHSYVAARNISSRIKLETLADGRKYLDLGSGSGMENQNPDLFTVKAGSASEPMLKFAAELDAFYRREVDHPSVADGEDQGSQRSSLTLNTRMWPLVSHVELERSFWTVGLISFAKIIMKILQVKGLEGIKEEDLKLKFLIKWPPMLPRDREVLVNEASIRSAANLGSTKHIMGLFDDIEDPEAQWNEIVAEKKAIAETVAKPEPAQPNDSKSQNNPDSKSGVSAPPSGKVEKKKSNE
jgi:hypothetical protein